MAGGPDSGSGAPAHPAVSALGTVRAGLGELAAANLWSLPDAGLLELRTEQERLLAQLQAAVLATTREIDSRGAATATGASSTAAWLRGALHLHPGAAKAEVGLAADLERDLVATGAALAAGAITREQAAAIRHGLSRLPAVVTADTRRRAEAFLLEQASSFDPDGLFKLSRHLMLRLDPDQGETLEREEVAQHERQQFTLVRQPDGTGVPRGQLSAESTALIQTALDAVAGPRPARDGTPDPRTPAQRRADGLTDLVRMAMGAPDMPEHGGEPVTLLVTVPRAALGRRPDGPDRLADATDPAGAENASFDDGTPLSPESARRLGCDAWLVAAVVGTGPEVLDIGRMARTVPRGIRRALVAREGGCAFPGCGRPARWCHAHHIWHWEDGGPTALWNLVLLCGRHHRVIHHHGWTVWIDPDTGRPVFRPPRWIDPDESPRPAWRPPTLPEHLPLLT